MCSKQELMTTNITPPIQEIKIMKLEDMKMII